MNIRVISRVIVSGLALAFIGQAGADQSPQLHSHRVFKVGVLATLTGSGSSLGIDTVAALQIAEEQLVEDAISQHGGYRFKFFVRDTQHDPSRALEAIKDLAQRGVQIIIGPQTSSELAMIKPFVDEQKNILVISQGSTAHSLAIQGDNIFRLCPDDTLEARAIVALMQHDGISSIVPLWRNDAGNNGLHDSVKARFEAVGGTVASGFRYETTTTDFTAATSSIASQITTLQTGGAQASTIAIYLAAFDEVVDVFHSAQSNGTLSSPRHWYGSDGVALSAGLTDDASAATFAESVDYPNPTFGLPDSLQSEWQPIANEIEARTGIEPDAFALSTYDVLFVLQRALQDVRDLKNFDAFKAAFVSEADAYSGITGSLALNSAGDRANGDFDFWAVRSDAWVRIGTYNSTTGVITIFP
jgi:branched-chain amino acid transport system substrate-binding protein